MKKRALIVGINYAGTPTELRGCINDAHHMKSFLSNRGFTDITLLLEKAATTAGIIAALDALVADVEPGDVIVFHYSGHGSQLPSISETDGFEEILCPIDLNWMDKVITDKTLKAIFNRVPNGVNITLILDCCHSGTMLNQASTLIQTKGIVKPKLRRSKNDRYMKPPANIAKILAKSTPVSWSTSRDVNATALLIAGCQENQTSADAFIDGIYQGAATSSILKLCQISPMISYKDLVFGMGKAMAGKYTQIPQLDGSPALYDQQFMEPFNFAIPAAATPAVEHPIIMPRNIRDPRVIALAGAILLALVLIFVL